MRKSKATFHVMAVDCCEHVLASIGGALPSSLTAVSSKGEEGVGERGSGIDLIVVGVTKYPVRRFFISQLRRVYAGVPVLLLRRSEAREDDADEWIRGEFILSDNPSDDDLRIVSALRLVMPFRRCTHADRGSNYDLVREVIRFTAEKYPDPGLNLAQVAEGLAVPPVYLSRLLNQKVGVSFRQLLRHTRIEEAKRMLVSGRCTVGEVAERVGFTDSHYFSRSFKQLTGRNASEYRAHQDMLFG